MDDAKNKIETRPARRDLPRLAGVSPLYISDVEQYQPEITFRSISSMKMWMTLIWIS